MSWCISVGTGRPACWLQASQSGRAPTQPCPRLGGLEDLIVSPDGRRAYVILSGTSGISVIAHRRELRTGRLTPAPWPAGCVTLGSQSSDCGLAPAVPGTYWDAVASPDGRSLYVLASGGVVALTQ